MDQTTDYASDLHIPAPQDLIDLAAMPMRKVIAHLERYEVPKTSSPAADWFDALTDEQLAAEIAPGQHQQVASHRMVRMGNRVELRNGYGYTVRRRVLPA